MNHQMMHNGVAHEKMAHSKHEGHSTQMFLRKFWIVLILTVPVLIYSDLFKIVFGFAAPSFWGSWSLALIFGSVIFFFGGWVFITGAVQELRARLPGMMTLIALAITAAYLWSVYAVFSGENSLFWELSTLIAIMLLGHFVEMKAVQGASGALQELAKLLPDEAEILKDGKTRMVMLHELKVGDIVLVKPGARVPADGKITEGQSDLNEAVLTGESKLQNKKAGDEVIAGTINGDGTLKIKVSRIGEQTFLAGVARLVSQAQASKSRLQVLSDRAALYLTIIAVLGGIATLTGWLLGGVSTVFAVARMVTVLVIACPHALGLAVPLVAAISTSLAAKSGFLIKQRLALEAARNVNVVLFDKTGTLTKGEFGVDGVIPVAAVSESEILKLAGSVNQYSEHSVAKAIVKKVKERNLDFYNANNFQRLAGKGGRAQVGGREVFVGSEKLLAENHIVLLRDFAERVRALTAQGKTVVYVFYPDKLLGAIALADIIREESREAVKSLKEENVKVMMITGDSHDVAAWVAGELDIKEYFAGVLPGQKAEKVKLLQDRGFRVAMVGDGVNDAPALAQADVGIAVGAGTNVAIESAGIILVGNDPRDIPKIIRLSRLTYAKMMQNIFWAAGYNIVAMPLAAGVLFSRGIMLDPSVGAALMSLSTVIVAVNALLLRSKRL